MNTQRQQAAASGGCSRLSGSPGGDASEAMVSCLGIILGHIQGSDTDEGHEKMKMLLELEQLGLPVEYSGLTCRK